MGENIANMVGLIADLKSQYRNRLNETTILRVVELNIGIAMQGRDPGEAPEGDIEIPDEDALEAAMTGEEPQQLHPQTEEAITTDPTTEDA